MANQTNSVLNLITVNSNNISAINSAFAALSAIASGTVKNRRPFALIADTPGVPDGLTIDADGGIWVALWGGAQVRRYSPDGRVTDIVNLPVEQPTSCTFGGDAGDTLYITTARLGLTDAQLAVSPLAGSVFACRPGYRGHPAHAFSSR